MFISYFVNSYAHPVLANSFVHLVHLTLCVWHPSCTFFDQRSSRTFLDVMTPITHIQHLMSNTHILFIRRWYCTPITMRPNRTIISRRSSRTHKSTCRTRTIAVFWSTLIPYSHLNSFISYILILPQNLILPDSYCTSGSKEEASRRYTVSAELQWWL